MTNLIVTLAVGGLAERLREELSRQKKKAASVSKAAGQSKNFVQSILDGDSQRPAWERVDAVARELDVSTEYLLTGRLPRERERGGGRPALEADDSGADGLERALATRWWDPEPVPPPAVAVQIANEARSERNLGASGLSAVYWVDYLRQRWRELRRPEKVATPSVDTSDDLGGGLGELKQKAGRKRRR